MSLLAWLLKPSSLKQHDYLTGALGPDGNLWFTEIVGNHIGRISPSGSISEFSIPTSNSKPYGIAKGLDHQLWFTEELGNKIGRITVPR